MKKVYYNPKKNKLALRVKLSFNNEYYLFDYIYDYGFFDAALWSKFSQDWIEIGEL